jgi:LuxR family maltose regulon positive regulatory protein
MLWAARIIEQHFDRVYNIRGEAATIHRWLSVLPAELVRSRSRLLLAQALMAATSGHIEVVGPLLDAVECAPAGWADEPFEPTAGVAASHLINVPATTTLHRSYLAQLHGDAEATAAFAAQALAESKPEERMLSASAHGFLAVAEWLRGRLAEAERAFASSVTGWREIGQLTITAWGYYSLALVRRAQGRLDAAALTCEQALHSLVTSGRPPPAAGPGYVGLAEIAYQRDELDSALRHATEGIGLCRQFVYTPPLANGLATLAMIRQATGDPAGTLEAITEAGQASPGPAGLLNPVPAQRARLLLAQGDLAAAARFPQENGLGPDDEPAYPREPGYLVLARVLLAQDRPGQALALLDRLHAAAKAQDRAGSLIETGALRALALAATGDEAGAVTALAGALLLACPQGYVRVFADEGPPMAALLGRLIASQRAGQAAADVPLGYLARLQRAFGPGQPARDPVPPGIVDPLTSRELEVLEMLAAGRPNQAIAGELVVTLDTVKKHVGHVLGKLGAANRTEAVARARQLSLIR